MKRARLPDGDTTLPCGATIRVAQGRNVTVFFGPNEPTPSRARVQHEVLELTGLPVWLENWPDDSVLHDGPGWPGIAYEAAILDYDERVTESPDLLTLGALLREVVELCLHVDIGWKELGVDSTHLPTFGGERPDVPDSFFWRWDVHLDRDTGLPPIPLSWDSTHMLIAADPHRGPFRVPRHPSHLFSGALARRCGLRDSSDAEAFAALASTLPWDGDMHFLGTSGLYYLRAHNRDGNVYGIDDPRDLGVVVKEMSGSIDQRARDVIAAGTTSCLRNAEIADEIIRGHSATGH